MRTAWLLVTTGLILGIGLPGALAAECGTEVGKAEVAVKAMKNADKKKTAEKALEMAREAQRDKMEGECLKHAGMALEGAAKE